MKKFLLLLTVIFAVCLLMVACGGDESEAPQTSTLAPHSHSYGIWNEVQAPSCTENGQREKACSCGEKITESINALGHSYEYGICKNCKTADKATEGLEYMESEDGEGYIVVGLGTHSSDGNFDLIIPDEYNGKPVIAIGENAFYNENKVRSVVVGKNVRTIGACAFYYISYLRSVVFLGEIEAIGDQAFENCYELSKINLPSSLESIGSCAFKSCKLKEITVSEENQVYSSIDGSLYSKDKKALILYAIGKNDAEFTVPSGVEKIGENAFFDCKGLKNVTVSEGLLEIGDNAFGFCSDLEEIYLTDGIKRIGDSAFNYCTAMSKIVLPKKISYIGSFAFGWCEALTVYCMDEEFNGGWSMEWNGTGCPVVWGHTVEE